MADDKAKSEAAAAPPPAEDLPEWPKKVTLRKPVMAYGDMVSELSMREPTGGDIEKFGDPVWFDHGKDPPQMHFHEENMAKMISGLAAVPPSAVKALHPRDWKNCAYELAGFFIPDGAM